MVDSGDGAELPLITTVADAAWKAQIEPYADRSPVVDIPKGVVACQFCGNTRFRRSRVRLGDVIEACLLRLPLRCMRCNQRQYGSYLTASVATGTKFHGPRLAKGNDTWKAWTEQEMGGGLHRPMSTAIGTKATKLHGTPVQGTVPMSRIVPDKTQGSRDESGHIW